MGRPKIYQTTDPDRPGTWIPYEKGLCETCQGICCTQETEVERSDLLRLGVLTCDEDEIYSDEEIFEVLHEKKILARWTRKARKFSLARSAKGDCVFLNENRRCKVYENRPNVCRNYPFPSSRPGFCPYKLKKI